MHETLILLISKGCKAIQEGKDAKSHMNQNDDNNASFYKPILDDDAYLQSLDNIIDLYYKSLY